MLPFIITCTWRGKSSKLTFNGGCDGCYSNHNHTNNNNNNNRSIQIRSGGGSSSKCTGG
jgi:hypothetical protein